MTKRLITVGEAAARLGVHRATAWRWCESGKMPAIKTPGGQYRVRAVDVEKIVKGEET